MEIPNSVRYFQRLNEMVKELASEMKGEKMPRLIDADKLKDIISDTWVLDRIDAQPTVDIESIIAKHEDIGYEKGYRDGYAEALEVTEDAEPVRHGHWILQTNGHGMCSTCGTFVDLLNGMTWEYCSHCGAKMDEENKEDAYCSEE